MSDPFPTEPLSAMTEERWRELAIRRIGLVIHAYVTYFPPLLTEDDIQREMKRLR